MFPLGSIQIFIAIFTAIWYNVGIMERRTHFYVSRKNALTWLMMLCMVASAVTRIVLPGRKGPEGSLEVWSQIILPIAAALLYGFIAFFDGKEHFYKTAIPIWLSALYFGLCLNEQFNSLLIMILCSVGLLFYCVIYTMISSGRLPHTVLLLPLYGACLCTIAYVHRGSLLSGGFSAVIPLLPDLLMIFGWTVLVFAIRLHPAGEYHPSWGDRVDGRRVRTLAPMSQIIPYIMVNRSTAVNYFSESFEITQIDRYIRQKRREGLTNFGITHVLLASYCRALAKFPALNRFVSGQKVYSRGNDIQFSMVVKKEMSAHSPDTVIKLHLTPYDTAEDVYYKLHEAVENVKNTPLDSTIDNLIYALILVPSVFLKFTVWLIKTMDYFGLLPKALLELSPFHGSLFFTSMGSLGISPVYHHLYDFGNLPLFGAFGCKRRETEVREDGSIVQRKYIDCKFTMDERIADGYYYASFFKHYRRILLHPEILDNPPEEVIPDID